MHYLFDNNLFCAVLGCSFKLDKTKSNVHLLDKCISYWKSKTDKKGLKFYTCVCDNIAYITQYIENFHVAIFKNIEDTILVESNADIIRT